jgi:hypothetical protein
MDALGEPGIPGDAMKILSTVNSLFDNCRRFLRFESDLNAAEVPSAFFELKDSFRGLTVSMVHVIDDLYLKWSRNTEALRDGARPCLFGVGLSVRSTAGPSTTPASCSRRRIQRARDIRRSTREQFLALAPFQQTRSPTSSSLD